MATVNKGDITSTSASSPNLGGEKEEGENKEGEDNNCDDNRGSGPDSDNDFEGKLLHQACLWDNSDLLSDLLFGEEVFAFHSR